MRVTRIEVAILLSSFLFNYYITDLLLCHKLPLDLVAYNNNMHLLFNDPCGSRI